MQPLTQNPYSLERWANVRVKFELVDVDAAEDATPTATSEAEISKLDQTHNRTIEMERKLATLEQNYFLLDGSFDLPDENDNGEVGWWSGEISDSNGTLATPQILEFNFTKPQSSIGFMVIFDEKANEYATDFTIQVYDGLNLLVGEDIVVGNTLSRYISEMPVDGYERVRIEFTKTSPFRRVRVSEVVFGIIQTLDEANTTKLKLLHELSPEMENLSSHELSVTIENMSRKYNLINPAGIYKYLQEGQGLDVEIGIGDKPESIERVKMGRYYFTSSVAEDSSMTAQLVANDRLYFLEGKCRIGAIGKWTVFDAVSSVITDSGWPITINIPSAIGNRIINKCIPLESTHRESLRLIAQAAKSICFINRNDELEFLELKLDAVSDVLDNSNLYEPAKVSVTDRINKVEITVRNDFDGTEVIYTATNKEPNEADKIMSIDNPLVTETAVADWLLTVIQQRVMYDLIERGNPAREIADTVKIYDAYSENRNAIIIKEEYQYDGTLKANTTAWGGGI